jgi:cytochrome c oxidase subunit II
MNFGEIARKRLHVFTFLIAAMALFAAPQAAFAQAETSPVASVADTASPNVADETVPAAEAADAVVGEPAVDAGGYTPLGPDMIKGVPVERGLSFQPQYSDDGAYALWMHDVILLPIITAISLLVLGLLLWVIVRYNRRRNAVPSKTSHNTVVEVIWTVVPVLILVVIAVPSISLIARQYQSPPEDALTIKVTGYQWYWGYTYPDNGEFEVISNMMDEGAAIAAGEPAQLAVDNRMVVPVGEPLRLQITAADVIHSFGIPSLWFKLDAVPGRLNERTMTINEPGIYYGQCFELCGARHAYMPIAIEAVPRPQFEAWVRSRGGTVGGDEPAALPSPAPLLEPESAVEGAPGAGAAPTQQTAPGTDAPAA